VDVEATDWEDHDHKQPTREEVHPVADKKWASRNPESHSSTKRKNQPTFVSEDPSG